VLRAARRAVALALALAISFLRFSLRRLRGPVPLEQRALWLHSTCRRVSSSVGIRCEFCGIPPSTGLLVSNHLSYLDVLIYGSILPCFFVSKAEVESWPVFGPAARCGGAMFLERGNRMSASLVAGQMAERLRLPIPVMLFPEGTSSDGVDVLRFHSRFFEPAVIAQAPVTAAAIRYQIEGGVEERELCWFGDALFLPHLWKTLGVKGFTASVCFAEPRRFADRGSAARQTHLQVTALRNAAPAPENPQPEHSLSRAD